MAREINASNRAFSISYVNILVLIAVFLLGSKGSMGQCTEGVLNQVTTYYNHQYLGPQGLGLGIGEDFTACATGTLSELSVKVADASQPSGGSLFIYEGADATGNLLATVPNNSIAFITNPNPTHIDLSAYNINVVAGQQYTFLFDSINYLGTNFFLNQTFGNTYVGGSIFSNGVRVTGIAADLADILFEIDIDVDMSTWNGSTWSNGTPNRDANAIIASSGSPGDFKAVNLTINSGVTVNLGSGDTALISGTLTNNGNGFTGSGVLDFHPGGANTKTVSLNGNAFNWEGIVNVASGHSLTTNGLLTLTASSASSYGILLGDGTVTDNISAQAYLDLTGVGHDGRYYHLGAPFNNDAPLSDFNEGYTMVSANNQQGTAWEWDAANALWVPAGGGDLSSSAVIGKGYALYGGSNTFGTFLRSGPGVLTVTGQPYNLDVTIALSYNDGQSNGTFAGGSGIEATEGWNFLANPYPAQLDWEVQDLQLPTDLENAIYVFNGSGYSSYVNGASSNGGSQYIAPFQAFFVQLDANTPGNFIFDADARVSGQTVELNKTNTPALDGINLIVSAQNGTFHDDIYVGFEPQSTIEHDSEWDARKLLNSVGTPNLSVAFGGDFYSICRVPYHGPRAFPIQLDYAVDGETMSISADRSNLRSFGQVTLEDLKDGTLHDLKHGDYTFTYDAGYVSSRFVLHFSQPSIDLPESSETTPIYAYPTENGLAVDLGLLEGARIEVFNLAGQRVASSKASQGILHLWLDDHGVFLVHIESDQHSEVIKVIR